jgi:uncharacterized protein (DUF1330 family)
MAKGYWIVRVDVHDAERFAQYAIAIKEVQERYGARFLARAGRLTCVEGSCPQRNTIVEFPSYEAALECWQSAEYQEASKLRMGIADMDLVVAEGC